MPKKKLIVFDMDGVLIDVSRSYRDTTRRAARLFLSSAGDGMELPDPLFSFSDLARIKQSGGLNNDWDLTRAVIDALFSLVECPAVSKNPDPWKRFTQTLAACSLMPLVKYLKGSDATLFSLYQKRPGHNHAFVTDMYTGDVGSGNVIKQIFQEIYLGKSLFEDTYHLPPEVFHREGLIHRESLLIDASTLSRLARTNILAIATGRPESEALYPLKLHGIQDCFTEVLTLDDCRKEEERIFRETDKQADLGKPDPFMLDRIAGKHAADVSKRYYIGDMPDDMTAAQKSAGAFTGIGVLFTSPDRRTLSKALKNAGARYVVDTVDELLERIVSDTQ